MKIENTNIFGPTFQKSLNLDSFYLYKTDFLVYLMYPTAPLSHEDTKMGFAHLSVKGQLTFV